MRSQSMSVAEYPDWLKEHLQYFYDLDEKKLLATCILGESANQSYEGKVAVGCVIRNRVNAPGWWGDTYHRVILSPWQFSCFNEGAPTLRFMRNPRGRAWKDCVIAARAILDHTPDITGGATHYFATYIKKPIWSERMLHTTTIGQHQFYKDT